MIRVLFVQSTLKAHGGGYSVAAWMLEALRSEFDVTLLTWRPPDFDALNDRFGTSLRRSGLQLILPNPAARLAVEAIPDPWSIQKMAYLLRMAKRIGGAYDVLVTAEMEADFGRPGIQYVHYPYLKTSYRSGLPSPDLPFGRKLRALVRGELRPWMILGQYSFHRMMRNLTLVNSDWTGRAYREAFGGEPITLYPPAAGVFEDVPWAARENRFVCIGRLHPGKRPDWAIEVLSRVRRVVPDIELSIIGVAGHFPGESEYLPRLVATVAQNASWVRLHQGISRCELAALLSHSRYGIHAMENEHFGMGIAEMVLAGAIPFVHASGGQVEIAGHEPALLYSKADDAVEKILAVLRDSAEQSRLRRHLAAGAHRFTPGTFMEEIRRVVRDFAERGELIPARSGAAG